MEKGDCSFLLENRDPSLIISKALVILQHQVTRYDVDRHLRIISQYIIVSKDGFLVKDLGNVMCLFEILKDRMTKEPRFGELLLHLLDLCFIPPKITKSSDLLRYALDIKQYFSWLGFMLVWLTDKNLQLKILGALYKQLTLDYPNEKQHVSLVVRREKAHSSMLAELLGELLEIVDDEVYGNMLEVLRVFIGGTKSTCIELLKKRAISTIILRLEPTWKERFPSKKPGMPTGQEKVLHTSTIFQVLTALFEYATVDTMRAPTKPTLWSLQWAFRYFCIKETTYIERNNVLGIVLSLINIYPDLLSGNLTFAYDIAMLAMSRDITFYTNWTSDIKLTTSYEDHSCMALLLMCISYFPNCVSGPKIIEECRIVMGLLKLIGHQQVIQWNKLQACYLIRLALNILQKVIPASTEEFIEDGGPLTILQLVHRSQKNQFSYSYDIVFRSLEILAHFSVRYTSIRDSVAYNGGVTCILPLLENRLEQHYLSMPDQLLLGVGLCVLEQICEVNEVRLVLPFLIKYMKRYIEPHQEDPVQNPKLIIIVLSFIWIKITPSRSISEEFVKNGGVYLILDVLQISCLSVRLVALGALIDLCERAECIPYLITWRKNGQRIKSLLMDIFRQENKELCVKCDKYGIIEDTSFPIMGRDQFYEIFCSCKRAVGNPSAGDMFISCRVKVFCILQILNSKQSDTVEVVDEVYKLYNEDLSAEDEITLLLAENFLALKLAEEWKELEQDFQKIGLEPVPFDDATISAMIQITDHWGVVLQHMQRDVLRKHQLREHRKEQDLYTNLRTSCLSDAWEALCQMKYIARCSERLFRVSSTFNLQTQINESLNINEGNGQMHRTLPSTISISCVHDQVIEVPTDVAEVKPTYICYEYSPAPSRAISFSVHDRQLNDDKYIEEDQFLSRPFHSDAKTNRLLLNMEKPSFNL